MNKLGHASTPETFSPARTFPAHCDDASDGSGSADSTEKEKRLLRAKVCAVTAVAEDLAVVEFHFPGGAALPEYSPGCHVDVTLTGPNGTQLVRQYSIFDLSSPTDVHAEGQAARTYGIAVKKEENSRGGSTAMLRLRAGDDLLVSKAHNNFELVSGAGYYVLVGAGVGIAPMLSMAQHLQQQRTPFMVLYFATSQERAVLRDKLREACGDSLIEIFGEPRTRQEEIYRHLLAQAPARTVFYVCGPQGFMSNAQSIVRDYLPREDFHWENFHPDQEALTGQKNAGAGDGAFHVEYCGEELNIPADKTVLEVLEEADLPVMSRCLEGTCSTCIMKVVEGEPDHRDSVYNDKMYDEGAFAPCVSRALSPKLVLERWRG